MKSLADTIWNGLERSITPNLANTGSIYNILSIGLQRNWQSGMIGFTILGMIWGMFRNPIKL
jgi:hypothetical protein